MNQSQWNTLAHCFLCYPVSGEAVSCGTGPVGICPCFLMIREAGQCFWSANSWTLWEWEEWELTIQQSEREREGERAWGTTVQPRRPQKHSSPKSRLCGVRGEKDVAHTDKGILGFQFKRRRRKLQYAGHDHLFWDTNSRRKAWQLAAGLSFTISATSPDTKWGIVAQRCMKDKSIREKRPSETGWERLCRSSGW